MIYLLVFLMSLGSLYYSERSHDKLIRCFFVIIAILLPSLLAGLRDMTIGTDTAGYPAFIFENVSKMNSLKDALIWNNGMVEDVYIAVAYYASRFFNDFNFFLFVISFLTISLLFCGGKVAKTNIVYLFALYFFMYFNTSLNTQRQAMALSACLVCMGYVLRNNYLMGGLALLLSLFLHSSALLFGFIVLLYFFIEKYPHFFIKKRNMYLMMIAIILLMLSFNAVLVFIGNYGIGEDKYIARYGSAEEYGSNFPISKLALNVYNMIVFWVITKRMSLIKNVIFGRYMTMISVLLCFLGLISTFAVRINDYFTFVNVLLLSMYLPKFHQSWKVSTIAFYIFYWVMIVVVANLGNTYPYCSKLLDI